MPSSLTAETLVIDRQITAVVHHYMPPDPMFPDSPGFVTDEILFDTTGLTNVDLSQYETFKLRLFTPVGQKLAASHADSYRSGLSIYYNAGADSSSHTEPAVLEFEDFVGSMPTRNYSLFYIGDSGNVVEFQADEVYPAGGTEFTAMCYSFTPTYNPANSSKNFTHNSSFGYPVYFSYQTSATTDPGPFVTLAAIPQAPETLNIDRQITGVVHHYMPPDPMFPGSQGYVTDEILFDTTGLTNVDLSQYETFKLRLFTPAGQKVVANHADSYRSGLSIYYYAGADSSSHTEPAVLEFEDFVGSMPTSDYSLFYIGDSGNVVKFQADEVYPAGGTEFVAMSYSFTPTYNPANSSKNFTQNSSFGYPVCFSYQTSATTDPGPFVTLAAIPQGPEIEVEQPAGIPLADVGSSIACGTAPVAYKAPEKTFTVKNSGTLDLMLTSVTTSGGNSGDFNVNTIGMATAVTPGSSTTFTVTFTPTGPGERGTTLQIFSDDEDESPFDIALTGTGLSFTEDGDGDGLGDGAEFQWAALGFDWQVSQPGLVNSFLADANRAGIYTTSQVQALHIDTPLIQRDGAGLFTLTLGLQKSATLLPGSFVSLPFIEADTQVNEGKIKFQFASPDNAAFFRVEGR